MYTIFHYLSENDSKSDAFLISSVANIVYFTGYAGFSSIEREAFLLITKNEQYIFTDGRYTDAIRSLSGFTLKEISATSSLTDRLEIIISNHKIKRLGFEAEDLHVAEFVKLKKLSTNLVPFSTRTLRMIKTDAEIAKIKRACTIGDQAFQYILKRIKNNAAEKQLAWDLEAFIRSKNADLSFPSIVAFGRNAATPHHHTGDTKLQRNQFVLFDFGVKYKNYCSDMTRTVFFGTPTAEQKKMYQTVLDAQQKAIALINRKSLSVNRGFKLSDVDAAAREYIISKGYPTIPHSLGHGIGLAVHEAPTLSLKSRDVLQNGMVFSIEPGIYLPKFGGVRIEDLFVVQNEKLTQLTKSEKNLIMI